MTVARRDLEDAGIPFPSLFPSSLPFPSLPWWQPPNALVVQLKRFVFSGRGAKIKTSLRFTDELRLAVSGPQRGATYDLTG